MTTASEEDLKKHGFPHSLTDPKDKARYEADQEDDGARFHYIEPTFEVKPDKFHGPRKPAEGAASESVFWRRHQVTGLVAYCMRLRDRASSWVQGDWVVPNVGAPTQGKWYYSSSWIGLDGDGSGDVCQAGLECEVFQSGTTVTRNIYPWFEWYPLPETKITNLPIGKRGIW